MSHATLVYRWAPRPMLSCRCTFCQLVTWSWPPPSKQCGYRKPIKTLSEKIKNRPNSSIIGQRFSPPSCKHCWGQEGVINIHPPFCYLYTERDLCRPHGCDWQTWWVWSSMIHTEALSNFFNYQYIFSRRSTHKQFLMNIFVLNTTPTVFLISQPWRRQRLRSVWM